MFCARLLLICAALWAGIAAQRVAETDMDPDFYCTGRAENEFFRKQMPDDITEEEARATCHTYYRCVPGGGNRRLVSKAQCGVGMFFDTEAQICDVRNKVNNCAFWEKFSLPKPKWPLRNDEVSQCPRGEIQCGSGECLSKRLFCDEVENCADGSDENVCRNPATDPNAAAKCDQRTCVWEEGCFCSVDGTRIPGDLLLSQTPQMITITFSGAVNDENLQIYEEIFKETTKNKGNDCTAKGTFFVTHAFTNYSAVQELHRRGHEIAVGSITNNYDKNYWSDLSPEEYEAEFDGARLITERYANISQGEILGMRVPQGRVGGNAQFKMMIDWGFLYDASLAAPRSRFPLWPYTLQHRMPHRCLGTDQNCPTRNFTAWEMVLNELDRRDDPEFTEALTGCHLIDQCANIVDDPKQFRRFLEANLAHHYSTNRAPLGLHFTAPYFLTHRSFLREFASWVADVASRGDYYFVTMLQAISWMEAPTEIAALNNFPEWKNKCDPKGLPFCSLPNPCESKPPPEHKNEDRMYLYTCEECPRAYPWLYDPRGEGAFEPDIGF